MSMKVDVFWDVASCSLVDIDRHYRRAYCLRHQGNEMLVNIYQTIWRSIPEGSHLLGTYY
jgi:hypothetical protein